MYSIHTSNVTVMVLNMEKAVNFYVEGLGLKLKQIWGDHYAHVVAPGMVIGLYPSDKIMERHEAVSLGSVLTSLKKQKDVWKNWGFFIRDRRTRKVSLPAFLTRMGPPCTLWNRKLGTGK